MAKYGKTWWGQQWLRSLEGIDYSNRLPRGRSYANKGAVIKIEFDENNIRAQVKGSRTKPYTVTIVLPPFFDPELSKFLKSLAGKPSIISKLLNRELDSRLLEIASDHGLQLFPQHWTDFKMMCSCPDWAVPCKHLAAVIYKICSEIDNNPFLVFDLHRVNLLEELNQLGLMIQQDKLTIATSADLHIHEDYSPDSALFDISELHKNHPFSKLHPIYESLTALLLPAPPFYAGSGDFKVKYASTLKRIVKKVDRIVSGKSTLVENRDPSPINFRTKISLVTNNKFDTRYYVFRQQQSFDLVAGALSELHSGRLQDYSVSVHFLHKVQQLSLHLIANGAITPQIYKTHNGGFKIRWLPAVIIPVVNEMVSLTQKMMPPDVWFFGTKRSRDMRDLHPRSALNLISLWITEIIRLLESPASSDIYLDLFFRGSSYLFDKPGEEALSGGIAAWLERFYLSEGKYRPQLQVNELAGNDFQLQISIIDKEQDKIIPLKKILTYKKYDESRFEILQSLDQLSSFLTGLVEHVDQKGKVDLILRNEDFATFLMKMIPAIELLNIPILLPKSMQQILKPKPTVKIKRKGSGGLSFLSLKDLFDFDWRIAIGDNVISKTEFRRISRKSERLIKYKSNYIYIDPEDLSKLHKHFSGKQKPTSYQLFRAALSEEYNGAPVTLSQEVVKLIREISNVEEISIPNGLQAKLRPYQKRGFSWMYRNAKIGFGSVIADDMGLGKTLQVISTILRYKEDRLLTKKKVLVVVPTSLISNWLVEIEKFAPGLRVHVFHSPMRKIDKKMDFDILLTTYGIVRSDVPILKKIQWLCVVLDEAQNIKNVQTAQAKAIKSIAADNFIAMSGTPVENRLSELWSILDFSNRGLLGSLKEFDQDFGKPIARYNNTEVAQALKKITAPFMLRRLKTDKSIISDLPDKIEIDCYAHLSKEQSVLYDKALHEGMDAIEEIEHSDRKSLFKRQGLVLQMIMALKQICNHPAQFLKNKDLNINHSGKTLLLLEKLDSIIDNGEKVLIFTQYAEMGKILVKFLTDRYGQAPLFFHGGIGVKKRQEIVNNFQNNHNEKLLILTIKSAGTGLNLTAANHVIHYDLWWNPAVEAQATDRAYRIGQKSNVMVHRFITKNTFEEKINDMIQSKKALADLTVATGESWIGDLSNKEIKEIFEINNHRDL